MATKDTIRRSFLTIIADASSQNFGLSGLRTSAAPIAI